MNTTTLTIETRTFTADTTHGQAWTLTGRRGAEYIAIRNRRDGLTRIVNGPYAGTTLRTDGFELHEITSVEALTQARAEGQDWLDSQSF